MTDAEVVAEIFSGDSIDARRYRLLRLDRETQSAFGCLGKPGELDGALDDILGSAAWDTDMAELVSDRRSHRSEWLGFCPGCQRYFDKRVGCLAELEANYRTVSEAAEEVLLSESRLALSKLDYAMQNLRIAREAAKK